MQEAQTARSPWLDTESAAAYVGASPNTLRNWRAQGKGPRYRVAGGWLVRYAVDDLDAWVRGEDGR
jgi:hypothetical protein